MLPGVADGQRGRQLWWWTQAEVKSETKEGSLLTNNVLHTTLVVLATKVAREVTARCDCHLADVAAPVVVTVSVGTMVAL